MQYYKTINPLSNKTIQNSSPHMKQHRHKTCNKETIAALMWKTNEGEENNAFSAL
jgi:hypothetical protein